MATVAEQLERLAGLVEKGFLTREQFEEERDRILAESKARSMASQVGPALPESGIGVQPGAEIGGYRLLELLGEGGMGRVFRARHAIETVAERQGGDVALKVIQPEFARDERYRDRFRGEVELGMRLDHPGLVRMHEYVADGDVLGVSMELVVGRSLADQLAETGPVPADELIPLMVRVLEAVGTAHAAGIVHRDLKPENIMLREGSGEPVVLDFGIAKAVDAATRTRTGVAIGTASYMPPEQHRSASRADQRSDVYALGMSMYELLCGRLPWADDADMAGVLMAKLQGDIPSPRRFEPAVPPALAGVVGRAIAVRPDDRWPDTKAFAAALLGADLSVPAPEPAQEPEELDEPEEPEELDEPEEPEELDEPEEPEELDEPEEPEELEEPEEFDEPEEPEELDSAGEVSTRRTVLDEPPEAAASPRRTVIEGQPSAPSAVPSSDPEPPAPDSALVAHFRANHRGWQVALGVILLLGVPLSALPTAALVRSAPAELWFSAPDAVRGGDYLPISFEYIAPSDRGCSIAVHYRNELGLDRTPATRRGFGRWDAQVKVPRGVDTFRWWAVATCFGGETLSGAPDAPHETAVTP